VTSRVLCVLKATFHYAIQL